MKGLGVARAALVAVAGTAMVWGASRTDASLDLTRSSDHRVAAAVDTGALTRAELVCPGPERPGSAGGGSQDVQLLTASTPTSMLPGSARAQGSGSVRAARLPVGQGGAPSVVAERGRVSTSTSAGAGAIDVLASGSLAPGLAALQVDDDRSDTSHGLSMAPCSSTAASSYLLAGGPQPGRLERVVLTNPSPNPVLARLSVLGTSRHQELTVPARSRTVTLLGSVDDTAGAPVVKVTSGSGSLGVAMSDTFLDGTRPVGNDLTGPATRPSTDAVVPAVFTGGERAAVRVGVPGNDDAVVRVQLLGTDDVEAVPDVVQTMAGGHSGTILLPKLPPGRYALRVTADVPVVAAAESVTGRAAGGASDLTWVPTSEPITAVAGTPVPRLPQMTSALMVSNPGDTDTQVVVGVTDAAGRTTPRTVRVPAGGLADIATPGAAAVWVRTTGAPVHAALVVGGSDGKGRPMLSAVPLNPAAVSAKVIDAREGVSQ
ncbi:DUF5719 family protein [Luteipulveratus halotolerans]|uniref:Secreted protein n=1 Tax=Luteipulveratus halotolerans TaxID=1631356 RepID=A0A0L6CIW3_9MICO|nr:DUF5719 family protein [Luteipulveratus halotolerans]KNX37742.1 hypothetical protein VV01_12240 [Luteipulveratus halotolerans]